MQPLKKYLAVVRTGISASMEYRANFFFNTVLVLIINAIVQMYLWNAVYASSPSATMMGMNVRSMIVYIALATVCSMLTRTTRADRQAGDEIRSGDLNKYLLKPINHALYSFSSAIGDRVASVGFIVIPALLVGIPLAAHYDVSVSLAGVIVALPILFLGLVINFLMGMCISYCAFWFDEVWTIHVVKDISMGFLSGAILPLSALPAGVRVLSELAPFQYLAYVPAGLMTGIIPVENALLYFAGAIAWSGILVGLTALIWNKGMQKYGAYGG